MFVLTLDPWVCQAGNLEAGKLPGGWSVCMDPHSLRLSPAEGTHNSETLDQLFSGILLSRE